VSVSGISFIITLLLSAFAAQAASLDCSLILARLQTITATQALSVQNRPSNSFQHNIHLRIKDPSGLIERISGPMPREFKAELDPQKHGFQKTPLRLEHLERFLGVGNFPKSLLNPLLEIGPLKFKMAIQDFRLQFEPEFLQDPKVSRFISENKIEGVFGNIVLSLENVSFSGDHVTLRTSGQDDSGTAHVKDVSIITNSPVNLSLPFILQAKDGGFAQLNILSVESFKEALRSLSVSWGDVQIPEIAINIDGREIPLGESIPKAVKSHSFAALADKIDEEWVFNKLNTAINGAFEKSMTSGLSLPRVGLNLLVGGVEVTSEAGDLNAKISLLPQSLGPAIDFNRPASTSAAPKSPVTGKHDLTASISTGLIRESLNALWQNGFLKEVSAGKAGVIRFNSPPDFAIDAETSAKSGSLVASLTVDVQPPPELMAKYISVKPGFSMRLTVNLALKANDGGTGLVPEFLGFDGKSFSLDAEKISNAMGRMAMKTQAGRSGVLSLMESAVRLYLNSSNKRGLKIELPDGLREHLKIAEVTADSEGFLHLIMDEIR
jgi:hypothetical protein